MRSVSFNLFASLRKVSYKMCRNIRVLYNFEPPATEDEIRAASLQFVRKISGFNKPSRANEASFYEAVEEIAKISDRLLKSLESNAAPKDREEEAEKAKARSAQRFGNPPYIGLAHMFDEVVAPRGHDYSE